MTQPPLTLGTAGHIDHGKTSLVEALTGTNTDRLAEEQDRGISIALGYASLALPDGRRLSVVDVPGHERFVRTMVAGATGIDLFLLVVDAGEGPRRQTLEHLEILSLLGVERGVVAVTKTDAVESERVGHTVARMRELVPAAEVVRVSARTRAGLDELVAALARAAATVEPPRPDGPARLYVDRVFSLPGAGTVATGTLWSGTIAPGDRLVALPRELEVRVRSVHVHGASVERAAAGQRVAVGVVAERRRELARGDALATPDAFASSYRLDVDLVETAPIEDGARVVVSHGTSAVPARVVRIGEQHAQLRLARPVVAAHGDRVVLRTETTVGGGVVVDPAPARHAVLAQVHAPERAAELERRGLLSAGLVRAGEWAFAAGWIGETRRAAEAALAARGGGLTAAQLLGNAPWAGDVAPLLGLEAREGRLYISGAPAEETGGGDDIVAAVTAAGLEPVAVEDAELARRLEREGRLVRLGDGLALSPEAYERARALLVEECTAAGTITLARYRDMLGSSRRVAQLLLERLDADRVTLRVGDARRLRRAAVG